LFIFIGLQGGISQKADSSRISATFPVAEDEMGGPCSTNGEEKKNAYRLLVGKPEGKRPLGRPRRRWVKNIRMDLVEVGWGDVDWIGLAQDRNRWRALVNSVLNLRAP
jgi:hypothetical protein